jgi:hypothetical protein
MMPGEIDDAHRAKKSDFYRLIFIKKSFADRRYEKVHSPWIREDSCKFSAHGSNLP